MYESMFWLSYFILLLFIYLFIIIIIIFLFLFLQEQWFFCGIISRTSSVGLI